MSKKQTNHLQKIKIWELIRQIRKMEGYRRISMFANTRENTFIKLSYSQINKKNETTYFNYEIQLTQTPCNFGGARCWFICPLYKEGKPCGRRVGVLFSAGDRFGCRYCYELTYASRNLSGAEKRFRHLLSSHDLEEIRHGVKRTFYKGRMTKKYLLYLRMEAMADKSYAGIISHISDRINKKTSK